MKKKFVLNLLKQGEVRPNGVLVAPETVSHIVTYMKLQSRRRKERDWGRNIKKKSHLGT